MSVQDKVERVLREFHVLISKSEPYQQDSQKVIVDKKDVLELLDQLKYCMSEMMEEYEITSSSRDRGEREARKKSDAIVRDAEHMAEDIYAASVLYSDEALIRIQKIIQEANDDMEKVFGTVKEEMKARQKIVRENQLELKSSLENLKDTDKYRNLIEERNKQLQKEKQKKEEHKMTSVAAPLFPAGKPEIKINPEYFEKTGRPMEVPSEEPATQPEQKAAQEMEIKVNLDAEYFRWRQKQRKKKADG